MNMNYNYLTTIFRSMFDPIFFLFLVLFTIFHFDIEKFISKIVNIYFSTRNLYIVGENTSNYCSLAIVVHVHATVFF